LDEELGSCTIGLTGEVSSTTNSTMHNLSLLVANAGTRILRQNVVLTIYHVLECVA